jgi:hypothetical protein
MIKDYKPVDPPKVDLGNLGLHNACGYYVPKDPKLYPTRRLGYKDGKGEVCCCLLICGEEEYKETLEEDCRYQIREQFDSPQEALLDYAENLREEHADLTNEQINKPAHFNGLKRSARWEDERRRRGLIIKT